MKFLHLLLNICIVILFITCIFFLNLFCTAEISIILFLSLLICSLVFIIVSLARKKWKRLSLYYFKGIKGIISIIIMLLFIVFNSFIVSAENINLERSYEDKITAAEKIKIYHKRLGEINKELYFRQRLSVRKNIKMKKVKYSYITFYYSDKKDFESVEMIESFLQGAERNVNRNFGTSKNLKVDVIVCRDKKTMSEIECGDEYIYNESLNTIFIYDYDNSGIPNYRNLFNHGYYFYRLCNFLKENKITMNNIPAWFEKGLETYYMNSGEGILYSPEDLKESLDFRKLDNIEDFKKLKAINYNPYLQSYYGVYYISTQYEQGAIKDILIKSEQQGFYEALESVTGINIDEFQAQYLKERINEYNHKKNK